MVNRCFHQSTNPQKSFLNQTHLKSLLSRLRNNLGINSFVGGEIQRSSSCLVSCGSVVSRSVSGGSPVLFPKVELSNGDTPSVIYCRQSYRLPIPDLRQRLSFFQNPSGTKIALYSDPSFTRQRNLMINLLFTGNLNCPQCRSSSVRRSRRQGLQDYCLRLLLIYSFRCRDCYRRFNALRVGKRFISPRIKELDRSVTGMRTPPIKH